MLSSDEPDAEKISRCLEYAAAARRQAERSSDQRFQNAYLKIAIGWEELAERIRSPAVTIAATPKAADRGRTP